MEGLRGIAALSVLAAHVHIHLARDAELGAVRPLVSDLSQGLTLFFVLSGFLLYLPFASAVLDRRPLPGLRRFLTNRVLRIYPAYLVVLLLAALPLGLAYTRSADSDAGVGGTVDSVGRLTDPLLLLANASLLHTVMPWSIKTGLGVSWSLTTEITFYLVLPILGLVALVLSRRLRPSIAVVAPAALMIVGGLVSRRLSDHLTSAATPEERFFLNWGASWEAVFARSLFPHADLFGWGMAAAVVLLWAQRSPGGRRVRWAVLILLVGTGLATPAVADHVSHREAWFAVGASALLCLCTLPLPSGGPSRVGAALDCAPLRWLGLISYGVYLWHIPVLWGLKKHLGGDDQTALGYATALGLVIAVVLPLAAATYLLVERPALRLKRSQTRSTAG